MQFSSNFQNRNNKFVNLTTLLLDLSFAVNISSKTESISFFLLISCTESCNCVVFIHIHFQIRRNSKSVNVRRFMTNTIEYSLLSSVDVNYKNFLFENLIQIQHCISEAVQQPLKVWVLVTVLLANIFWWICKKCIFRHHHEKRFIRLKRCVSPTVLWPRLRPYQRQKTHLDFRFLRTSFYILWWSSKMHESVLVELRSRWLVKL